MDSDKLLYNMAAAVMLKEARGKLDEETTKKVEKETKEKVKSDAKKDAPAKNEAGRDAKFKGTVTRDWDITRPLQALGRTPVGGMFHTFSVPGMGLLSPSDKHVGEIRKHVASRPELQDVTVQLGHTSPLSASAAMWNNPNFNTAGKFFRIPVGVLQSVIPNVMGMPHYNPFLHSVHSYGDSTAITKHELGHAASMQGSIPRTLMMAAERGLLFGAPGPATLTEEALANVNASRNLTDKERAQTGRALFPSYGSYLGGTLGGLGALGLNQGSANSLSMVWPGVGLGGILGMGLGGVAGAAYNRMKGHRSTGEALGDATRAMVPSAIAAVPAAIALDQAGFSV